MRLLVFLIALAVTGANAESITVDQRTIPGLTEVDYFNDISGSRCNAGTAAFFGPSDTGATFKTPYGNSAKSTFRCNVGLPNGTRFVAYKFEGASAYLTGSLAGANATSILRVQIKYVNSGAELEIANQNIRVSNGQTSGGPLLPKSGLIDTRKPGKRSFFLRVSINDPWNDAGGTNNDVQLHGDVGRLFLKFCRQRRCQ